MKRAYIAGPYRAPTERQLLENIHQARLCAERLWQLGYAVMCPHLNTAFCGGIVPDDVFLRGDLAWLECADIIVMLPTWERSQGARAEREFALQRGIRVATLEELEQEEDVNA